MSQIAAIAVAQTDFRTKPTINPDAYYTIPELEAYGLGKYLKFRRAIIAGKLEPTYCGRNLLIRGSSLLAFLGVTKK